MPDSGSPATKAEESRPWLEVDVPWEAGAAESPLGVLADLPIRNVVVVEVDTLRADHLPFYESRHETMPETTARGHYLAMSDYFSATSWTNPSVASLLTGLDAHEHGVLTVSSSDDQVTTTTAPMVQGWLGDHGIETAMFNGNSALDRSNLTAGWDHAETITDDPGNGVAVVEAGLAWLDGRTTDAPFVLHLRPSDPHRQWAPMPEDRGTFVSDADLPFSLDDGDEEQAAVVEAIIATGDEEAVSEVAVQIRDVYDEEILGLDRALSLLYEGLKSRGLLDETLVVLTADHGETMFDRDDTFGHGGSLHNELVAVPLVFFHPDLEPTTAGGCATQSWDLYPTLFELLGVPPMEAIYGASALAHCRTEVRGSLYQRTMTDDAQFLSRLMIMQDNYKLVARCSEGARYWYDLSRDPLETND